MTVRIAGAWELGWNTPIKELDLWEYPLREFAIDELVMSPVSGIFSSAVTEVVDLGAYVIAQRTSGMSVVFCDEAADVELPDFIHPENALYVFGKSGLSPYRAYRVDGDLALKIPTSVNQGGFWPHQVASIILYDRFLKAR